MRPDEAAFLEAIRRGNAARLVLAYWLQERDDPRDPRQAAILAAQLATLRDRGIDHRVVIELGLEQRARAVAPGGEQADFAQRLRFFRDLRLALAEQRRELANRQLLFGAQCEEPQPIFVAEEAEQICAMRLHEQRYIPSCA